MKELPREHLVSDQAYKRYLISIGAMTAYPEDLLSQGMPLAPVVRDMPVDAGCHAGTNCPVHRQPAPVGRLPAGPTGYPPHDLCGQNPTQLQTRDARLALQILIGTEAVAHSTKHPLGYVVHYLIAHTKPVPGDGQRLDALYAAFRNYVPDTPHIPNVGYKEFTTFLTTWADANIMPFASDRTGTWLMGLAMRDKPYSPDQVEAYLEGWNMR